MALFTPSKGFKTLDFQTNSNTRVTTSVSGKTHRRKIGAQFWSARLKSPQMAKADFMADYSFVVQQDGQFGSFTIILPEVSSSKGTVSGTITVNATVSTDPVMSPAAGSSKVGVDTVATGTLKKGDLIKFSNHSKVYMLTEDVDMDGSSVNTLDIYPPLQTTVTASHTVTYDNVPLTVFSDKDQIKYVTSLDGTFKYEIILNEEV